MANPPENCKEIFAALSQYIDLELPSESCEEIEEHLRGCAPCIEFVRTLRQTIDLCRQYRPDALPDPLGEDAKRDLRAAYERALRGA